MPSKVVGGGTALHSPYIFTYSFRYGKLPSRLVAAAATNTRAATAVAADAAAAAKRAATTTATTEEPATGGGGSSSASKKYESSIRTIQVVHTVEEFWETYDFLKRPNDLPKTTDYHVFLKGIKPTWEDPGNAKGGKWIIRLPKGLASRYWEEVVLALIGAQFTRAAIPMDEICGVVLSIRSREDILAVWNRHANDRDMVDNIRDVIKKVLHLPHHAHLEYKPHQTSLQDNTSFLNTQVWKPVDGGSGNSSRGEPSSSLSSSTATGSGSGTSARRSGSWTERDKAKHNEMRSSWWSGGH